MKWSYSLIAFLLIGACQTFSSCESDADQHKVVCQFMEEQTTMTSPEVIKWSSARTTQRVTPQAMQNMRASAVSGKLVKKGVKYAQMADSLVYFDVKVVSGTDTLNQTYYLNPKEQGVVGFK